MVHWPALGIALVNSGQVFQSWANRKQIALFYETAIAARTRLFHRPIVNVSTV